MTIDVDALAPDTLLTFQEVRRALGWSRHMLMNNFIHFPNRKKGQIGRRRRHLFPAKDVVDFMNEQAGRSNGRQLIYSLPYLTTKELYYVTGWQEFKVNALANGGYFKNRYKEKPGKTSRLRYPLMDLYAVIEGFWAELPPDMSDRLESVMTTKGVSSLEVAHLVPILYMGKKPGAAQKVR